MEPAERQRQFNAVSSSAARHACIIWIWCLCADVRRPFAISEQNKVISSVCVCAGVGGCVVVAALLSLWALHTGDRINIHRPRADINLSAVEDILI